MCVVVNLLLDLICGTMSFYIPHSVNTPPPFPFMSSPGEFGEAHEHQTSLLVDDSEGNCSNQAVNASNNDHPRQKNTWT